jgi:hypothetical protein
LRLARDAGIAGGAQPSLKGHIGLIRLNFSRLTREKRFENAV